MKKRYVVVQRGDRGGMCYCKDTDTGARPSLHTRDREEAERLVKHKNEAIEIERGSLTVPTRNSLYLRVLEWSD